MHASPLAFVFIRHFPLWLMMTMILKTAVYGYRNYDSYKGLWSARRWNIMPYFSYCPVAFCQKVFFLLQLFVFLIDVFFIFLGRGGSTLGPVLGLLVTVYSE